VSVCHNFFSLIRQCAFQAIAHVYLFHYVVTNYSLASGEVRDLFYAHLQNCEKRLLATSLTSFWYNSTHTGRIVMKFSIWVFFENLSSKLQFNYNLTRITGSLYEDLGKLKFHYNFTRKTGSLYEDLGKLKFHYNLTRKTGSLYEDLGKFMIVSR
jgi:hypothetical protein